jgi:hypothetical protein
MMDDDDRKPDLLNSTPEDEDTVLDFIQMSFAAWMGGVDILRASVDEWAQLRKRHLAASSKALRDVEQLPSDQKPSAASDVLFEEVGSAIKDFGAAMIRAMMLASAAARQLEKSSNENQFPFSMRQWPDPKADVRSRGGIRESFREDRRP